MNCKRAALMSAAQAVVAASPSLKDMSVEGELPCYGPDGNVRHFLRVKDPHLWTHISDEMGATDCWVKLSSGGR